MSRIAELANLITKAKQSYYFGDGAIMSDDAYDALEDELGRLDPDHPILKTVGAPVPADAILTKAEHSIPMGSQSKVNSAEDFVTWYDKSADGGAIHVSLKGDGASAAAYYENGHLKQAISRGDGKIGEDITANAVKFKGLPAYVEDDGKPFSGAVRMEVILTVADWAIVDPDTQKNPRNLGNGIMGRKNGVGSELLTAFAFDITETGREFTTEHDKIDRLQQLGFQCIDNELCTKQEEVAAYFEKIQNTRDKLPFWIDGIVLKIDDLEQQEGLGTTSGRPKGQVAWKFKSEGAETKVLGVVITGGHTGSIVPTAQLEPVEIGGTTVQNALLNNWEEIARLDVAVGDSVFVIKANDIIPKVTEVLLRPKNRKLIEEPTVCPFCDGDIGRNTNSAGDTGAITVCLNAACEMKSAGKIKRWLKSLDIQGIGDSVRTAMIEQLELRDPSDLYLLHNKRDALAEMIINEEKDLRFGEKRTDNVLAEIDKSRDLTLIQFLGSLGVGKLGKRRVELMVNGAEGELNKLEDWQSGKLRDADFAAKAGVPTMGTNIQDDMDGSKQLIEKLLANGVSVSDAVAKKVDPVAAANETTLCITGKLPSGKKKADYKAALAKAGIKLVDAVSADLNFLVLADPNSTSSKAKKARKLNVKLIDEDELVAML